MTDVAPSEGRHPRFDNVGFNARWSVAEFLISAVIQFLLIRFIVEQLGVGSLGIWATLMAVAQVSKFGDAGLAAGAARLLAPLGAGEKDRTRRSDLIGAALAPSAALYVVLSAAIFLVVTHLWPSLVPGVATEDQKILLAVAVATFASQSLAGAGSVLLLGLHAGSLKSKINICSSLAQGALAIWLVSRQGLLGFALAQLGGFLASALVGIACVCRMAGVRARSLVAVNSTVVLEILPLGAGVQAASALWSLLEICTRLSIVRVAGLEAAGLFEAGQKLCSQARVLCAQVAQTVAPRLSAEFAVDRRQFVCSCASFLHVYLALALLAGLALTVAIKPYVWLMFHTTVPNFWLLMVALIAVVVLQIAAMPAEVAAIASGLTRWNTAGYAIGVSCSLAIAAMTSAAGNLVTTISLATGGYLVASVFNLVCNTLQLGIRYPSPLWSASALRRSVLSVFSRVGPA
jgi:O-antigen/teichoic acid export membrane protein